MMTLPTYTRPRSLSELIETLSSAPGGFVLAGGTDLLVQMRLGLRRPDLVADVGDVTSMHRLDMGEAPVLGAAVTIRSMIADAVFATRFRALAQAGALLGGRQIQGMATIGGNLCNASPAAETATPFLVFDAVAVVAGPAGERHLPLTEFWQGPGRTALGPGEVLVEVRIPSGAFGEHSAYRRLALRRSVDIAIVSVSASFRVSERAVSDARVAIGAVAPTPRRVPAAEEALVGLQIASEPGGGPTGQILQRVAEAAAECRRAARPIDDARASASYRGAMVEVVARRAMLAGLGLAET